MPAHSSTTVTQAPATVVTSTTIPSPAVEEDARAVILAGLSGTTLDAQSHEHLAGGGRAMILFTQNLESRDQVRALTSAMACTAGAPILVAVDQEPGRIARLAPIGITSPDPLADKEAFATGTKEMARTMFQLGINLDLAPVIDVSRGPNPVLVDRNFGPDPVTVTDRGLMFISLLGEAGVGSTAKHFPGHGLSTVDPHLAITRIDADFETLQAVDFPPFQTAIDGGVGAVMIGHPIYAAIDPDNPASLSPAVLNLLRTSFGFEGVAMTDALSMQGVREGRDLAEISVAAIAAGEDLLIVNKPEEVEPVVEALVGSTEQGTLDRGRLAEAARRVRQLAESVGRVECPSAGVAP